MIGATKLLLPLTTLVSACAVTAGAAGGHFDGRSVYRAPAAAEAPAIDGVADDPVWRRASWRELAYRWLGPAMSEGDFAGRFKLAWTAERLYLLGEFTDDVLYDAHRDPLEQYWNDDCLEIYLDEDFSGGDHQYNHNAFAYHVALDNQVVDLGTDRQPRNYSSHLDSVWKQRGDKIVWEVGIDVYGEDYVDGAGDNQPVRLAAGKVMGFMLAWCDNDGSATRENFIGSEAMPGEQDDRGWIDAGVFGELRLMPAP